MYIFSQYVGVILASSLVPHMQVGSKICQFLFPKYFQNPSLPHILFVLPPAGLLK